MFVTKNKKTKLEVIQLLHLLHQLNIVITFFHRWFIKINASKTKSIFFGESNTTYLPTLLIDSQTIEQSNSIKYLGVNLINLINLTSPVALRVLSKTQPETTEFSTLS